MTVPVINSNSSLVCGRVVSRTSVARAENVLSLQITPNVVVGASDRAALDVEPLVVSTSVPPFYLHYPLKRTFIASTNQKRLGQFHHASVCRVSSDCAGSVTAEGDATCQP